MAIPPFGPVASPFNTYSYHLSKYLRTLPQPDLPSTYTISDSFSFAQELKTVNTCNKFMVSFDMVSLFTNVPLKESIDLAVSYILEGNKNLKLSKSNLTKLFSIATSQIHFLFYGKVHSQIDGVEMGSPPVPVLANVFFGMI